MIGHVELISSSLFKFLLPNVEMARIILTTFNNSNFPDTDVQVQHYTLYCSRSFKSLTNYVS